jgi:hypothetical protein
MNPFKFIKAVSETYFAERSKIQHRSRRWWSVTFIGFFALYLFQVYAAYADWQILAVQHAIYGGIPINLDEIWQNKTAGMYLQGIVLGGIFIRFLFGQFRGKWSVRFGELGEYIAIAGFLKHFALTYEFYSHPAYANHCGPSSLIGLIPFVSQWLTFFCFCWIVYKFTWIIAVTCETVRK